MIVKFNSLPAFIAEIRATPADEFNLVRAEIEIKPVDGGKEIWLHCGFLVEDTLMEFSDLVGNDWEGGDTRASTCATGLIEMLRSPNDAYAVRGGRFSEP